MPFPLIRRFRLLFVLLLISSAGAVCADEPEPSTRWFRGNLHTHSHWSDGDDYLENIAIWYREQEYQFLVFTDHNVLANNERSPACSEPVR